MIFDSMVGEDSVKLKEKVIVVTGAGSGIGAALCRRFAAENPAAIVVSDQNEELATSVAEEIGGFAVECDVADESQIQRLVESTEKRFERVDLFCGNAGIGLMGGAEVSDEDWKRVMDVNFMSHVYSTRAVLPGMLARGEGYLLHTASAAGLLTQVGSAPYAVSKHAAVAFSEWLAITHGDQGIKVSCLCPLGVKTRMLESDHPVVQKLAETAILAEQVAEAVVEGIDRERFLILPHAEVAGFVEFKAKDPERWLEKMRDW